MKSFTDTTGAAWRIAITLGAVDRVRDACGLDLLTPNIGEPSPLQVLAVDNRKLLEILGELLERPEAGSLKMAEIRDRFDGRTLGAAKKAFFEELADFFRELGDLGTARLVEKALEAQQIAAELAASEFDELDVRQVLTSYVAGYGKPPASSASTRGRSRSGKSSK